MMDAKIVNVREDTKEAASSSNDRASNVTEVDVEGTNTTSRSNVRRFTFQELSDATYNFRSDCLVGEGGFGLVYKGRILDTNEVVAIKQLYPEGLRGKQEFKVIVKTSLGLADHPNLVKLIGYCAEGYQRLLVYEHLALGSLSKSLEHGRRYNLEALDWKTRMTIALGAARGIDYLHNKAKPEPFIHGNVKSSNILIAEGCHPKLSDIGLIRLLHFDDYSRGGDRWWGTPGYADPDIGLTGRLTFSGDVYMFGVVLLELITGKKAATWDKDRGYEFLVRWAKPWIKKKTEYAGKVDPLLGGRYPPKGLEGAVLTALVCLRENPKRRPHIAEVVKALENVLEQV